MLLQSLCAQKRFLPLNVSDWAAASVDNGENIELEVLRHKLQVGLGCVFDLFSPMWSICVVLMEVHNELEH